VEDTYGKRVSVHLSLAHAYTAIPFVITEDTFSMLPSGKKTVSAIMLVSLPLRVSSPHSVSSQRLLQRAVRDVHKRAR